MSLLRITAQAGEHIRIDAKRVYLRPPLPGDYEAWAALREASRDFLIPWEPRWPADDLSRPAYRRRIKRHVQEMREDKGYALFIFRQEDAALMGGLNLSNVQRGVSQSCSLGYWMGLAFAGQGYMREAVKAVLPFVFTELGLHRLEAACVPNNEPSKAVLRKTGFQEEGLARRYLRINGVWADHLLFALLDSDLAARKPQL
ncbi:MAG TPA: 30S ribosomal protein S5 alanine N-acetyltransferase [Alphaproteobacteria bacterium]|jgi:[ribosomal protein S5]-alanine N-acetyltransferase|nr:30S ribosomal protein S5 alanine N-acetyltransferase [Alphaproteobacteria bacterium]